MTIMRIPTRLLGAFIVGLCSLAAGVASAHPIMVDGASTDWFNRLPNTGNLGMVARDAASAGEYIWRDASADTRTDLSTPEVVADIVELHVTATPTNLSFLVRRPPGVLFAGSPIQVQIAIDTDLVSGSGQSFFAGFADTSVAAGARWERLVQTLFGSGGTAQVIDTNFNQVATAQAAQGTGGDVEISLPWSALGLGGPPATPLRFTVATLRAQANDNSIDVGGPGSSNVLDAVTNYANPAASAFPNTFADVQDQTVDYAFDVYFSPSGEVYAPLVVQSLTPNAPIGGSDEWYTVKNVSPATLSLTGFALGDEETPDSSGEGMFAFPPASTLAPGASFVVARSAVAYENVFGVPPDAELGPGSSGTVVDMNAVPTWASALGTVLLADAGDELLVLDPSSTILDVAVFGNSMYAGITPFTPAPGANAVLSRNAASTDTDTCLLDFSNVGVACTSDAQCGGTCLACMGNVCGPKAQGAPCPDADLCNGPETCDAAGACLAGAPPDCDDQNACTVDSCDPLMGCQTADAAAGTACDDGDACTAPDTCDANGTCLPGVDGCGGAGGASSSSAASTSASTSAASTSASSTGASTGATSGSTGSSTGSGSGPGGGGGGGTGPDGGCNCEVGREGGTEPLPWIAGLAFLAAIARRTRRMRRK